MFQEMYCEMYLVACDVPLSSEVSEEVSEISPGMLGVLLEVDFDEVCVDELLLDEVLCEELLSDVSDPPPHAARQKTMAAAKNKTKNFFIKNSFRRYRRPLCFFLFTRE